MSHDDEASGRATIGPAEMKVLITLLDELLELPDDAAREQWLAERPAEQGPLLPALRRMMAARDASALTLDRGPGLDARVPTQGPASNLQAGQCIGRYRLLRELGHGGMSEVWLARATDDAAADAVALKLPAVSLASPKFLERLSRERAILQRLTHPRIVQLIDGGVAETGQQYLALAYVDGQPLDRYADQQGLTVDARIELVLQVLDAVRHAHERDVLHRDLKPSNILVTAQGQVRLLDFGIAKLLVDGQAHETELTERWGRALTPAYASPEQRLGAGVTVRSDLYALGVILYELLTGGRPPPLAERVDELPPPSQAVVPGSTVARAEGGAQALARRLERDLDDIVLQALQTDASRRPADADSLAAALQAARQGWPARAWTRRAWLALRSPLRRHRVALVLVVPVWLLLGVAGPVHGLAGWIEAVIQAPPPPALRPLLVTVGPDDHRRLFGGQRPLDAATLQRLVVRILEGRPARLGVDIDTSHASFAALRDSLGPQALSRVVWARELQGEPANGALPGLRAVLGAAQVPPGGQAALAVTLAGRDGGRLRWYTQAVDTAQGRLPTLGAALAGHVDGDTAPRAIGFAAAERTEWPASLVLAPGFSWGDRLRGRTVVLGGRYDPGDEHPTPLGLQAGVEVLAQITESELVGGGYRRPGIGQRLLLGLLPVLVALGAAQRLGARGGAAAAAAALWLAALAWSQVGPAGPWAYLLVASLVAPLAAGRALWRRADHA